MEYTEEAELLLPAVQKVAATPKPTQGTREFYLWYVCNQMVDFPESAMCGLMESGEVAAVCYYADDGDYLQLGYLVSFKKGAGHALFRELIKRKRYPRVYVEPINNDVAQLYRSWGFRDVAPSDPHFGEDWEYYLVYN